MKPIWLVFKLLMSLYVLGSACLCYGQDTDVKMSAWKITNTKSITNTPDLINLPLEDNIEMSGRKVSAIITYKIDKEKNLQIERQVFFPQLRTFLKSTDPDWYIYRSYLKDTYKDDIAPQIVCSEKIFVPGAIQKIAIDGILQFVHQDSKDGLQLTRTLFPSPEERIFVEQWKLTNKSLVIKKIFVATEQKIKIDFGVKGTYARKVSCDAKTEYIILPNESISFSLSIAAKLNNEEMPDTKSTNAEAQRRNFIEKMNSALILETPNDTLNTLFNFSKIRGAESIFDSKLGLLHSPGGGRYYCGIWANDQIEYIGPFFPYLGYDLANEAALNMYRLYLKEINKEYKNIRFSFEIEGDAPVNPLDRGDAAMIAYGTAQFIMARGDKKIAEELFPLLEWCLEYCHKRLNSEGVVLSESDEMEGRIETGNANLATSCLYYGALQLTADLYIDLGKPKHMVTAYKEKALLLNDAIENYFGDTIEGLHTYKYYKQHQQLRYWICLPLVVGINKRAGGTLEAIFNKLWTDNGVHVEKNSANIDISKIFWDRGTLYALRGAFLSGAVDVALAKLEQFSAKRLLGNHVPYVVEAYPEGNMAHLSAESGLYCRVFTEGLFGIVPKGLKSFYCSPRLPVKWDKMQLKNIMAFGENFNLSVSRTAANNLEVIMLNNKTSKSIKKICRQGQKISFAFGK